MNPLKSRIRSEENRRKFGFAIKLIFLILLEYLYEGYSPIQSFLQENMFLSYILRASIFLLSASLIISFARFIVLRFYLKKTDEDKVQPNFVLGINRIATLLNVFATLISIMLAFGINPIQFLTSITIVAAAIAILTKDYITNIVNGLIIMFSDQLAVGDKVKIGNQKGFIQDITLINLVLKDDTGDTVIIPNNLALTVDVVNYSRNNSYQISIDAEITISPDFHLEKLDSLLLSVLKNHETSVVLESAFLSVLERKPTSLLIRYHFPLKMGSKSKELAIRQDINQVLISENYG